METKETVDSLLLKVKNINQKDELVNLLQLANQIFTENAQVESIKFMISCLLQIDNPIAFIPLLNFIVGKVNHPDLANELYHHTDRIFKKDEKVTFRRQAMVDHMLQHQNSCLTHYLQKISKQNSGICLIILSTINQLMLNQIAKNRIPDYNFSFSLLLSLKLLQNHARFNNQIVEEALKHISLNCSFQKGQIQKVTNNCDQISVWLKQIGAKTQPSKFWYYLIGKLIISNSSQMEIEGTIPKNTFNKLAFAKIKQSVDLSTSLESEILKVTNSILSNQQKDKLVSPLRGWCFFIYSYTLFSISKKVEIDGEFWQILLKLMQIKDWVCFQYLLKALQVLYINEKISKQYIIKNYKSCIIENCLPLNSNIKEGIIFEDVNLFQKFNKSVFISINTSQAMDFFLDIIFEEDEEYFPEEIRHHFHKKIQNQYDKAFNSFQFMSGCSLICRFTNKAYHKLIQSQIENKDVKQYILNQVKWLLNLNESCLPEHREYVFDQLFCLILSFPSLMKGNPFLQEVVENKILCKPHSKIKFIWLMTDYLVDTNPFMGNSEIQCQTIKEQYVKRMERFTQKIFKSLNNMSLSIYQRYELWSIIVKLWSFQTQKLMNYFQIFSYRPEHFIPKYCASKLNLTLFQNFESSKLNDQVERIRNNACIFRQQMEFIFDLIGE